jgi:hypothetical protein
MIITTRNTLSPPHHPLSNTKHTLRPFFNTEIPSVIRIREEFKSKTYPRDNGGWCCSTRIWDAIGYRVTLGGVWRAVVVVLRMEVVVLLDTRLGRVQVSSDAGRGVASCGGGCGLWCREWWWSCLGRVQGWRDVGRGVVVLLDTHLGRIQVSSDAGQGVGGLWLWLWVVVSRMVVGWSCLGRVRGWRDIGRGVGGVWWWWWCCLTRVWDAFGY